MGFLEEYKRLEKLCGEIMSDNRRVSAYIEEMLNTPKGSYLVKNWDDDLKQLKHYRWIRNQIAHDPNCSEENMCNFADSKWIADFHFRIMNQTDPLALYRKATQPHSVSIPKKNIKQIYQEQPQYNYNNKRAKQKKWGCGTFLLIAFMIVVVGAICFLLTVLN